MLEIIGGTIVALIAAIAAVYGERYRAKQARLKEAKEQHEKSSAASVELTRVQINDEAIKRKELEDAARDIRDYLTAQLKELNEAIDIIEQERKEERAEYTQEHERRLRLEFQLELYIKKYGEL
jgi:gas vesicle protein